MVSKLDSLKPIEGGNRSLRRRLDWKAEFVVALMPTAVVLIVLALVEALSDQRLLFASLASSAFLIYLDPEHGANRIRTLVLAQLAAATLGLITYLALGSTYTSAGTAMVLSIVLMIALDAVHPPAVATSVSFAWRAGDASNLLLFCLALAITAVLVVLQRVVLRLLAWYGRH